MPTVCNCRRDRRLAIASEDQPAGTIVQELWAIVNSTTSDIVVAPDAAVA